MAHERAADPNPTEIELTPEMIAAGADQLYGWLPNADMPGREAPTRYITLIALQAFTGPQRL